MMRHQNKMSPTRGSDARAREDRRLETDYEVSEEDETPKRTPRRLQRHALAATDVAPNDISETRATMFQAGIQQKSHAVSPGPSRRCRTRQKTDAKRLEHKAKNCSLRALREPTRCRRYVAVHDGRDVPESTQNGSAAP